MKEPNSTDIVVEWKGSEAADKGSGARGLLWCNREGTW
jgi:hypothetical protein